MPLSCGVQAFNPNRHTLPGPSATSSAAHLRCAICPAAHPPLYWTLRSKVWMNAYSERPLVSQAEDGTPIAFYVGLGRTSCLDGCNWPVLFCTGKPGEICGPTLEPR